MNAQESYQQARKEIDDQIRRLKLSLLDLDKTAKANPKNWAIPGTALHIKHQLDEITQKSDDEEYLNR